MHAYMKYHLPHFLRLTSHTTVTPPIDNACLAVGTGQLPVLKDAAGILTLPRYCVLYLPVVWCSEKIMDKWNPRFSTVLFSLPVYHLSVE